MTEEPEAQDQPLIRCARCRTIKPASAFNWRRQALGQRDTYCRPCRADYHHEHYVANRQKYIAQNAARRRRVVIERTTYLLDYFSTHPCVDCGETDPLVLEFDHLRDKRFEISQAIRNHSWEDVLLEIEKCEVRCANCHRRVTGQRLGFYRGYLTGPPTEDTA